jgi:hypothetical protein
MIELSVHAIKASRYWQRKNCAAIVSTAAWLSALRSCSRLLHALLMKGLDRFTKPLIQNKYEHAFEIYFQLSVESS